MKKVSLKTKPRATRPQVVVKALRTAQGKGINVFSFFMPLPEVTRIADMSRAERDNDDSPKGLERRDTRTHVRGIVDCLNQGRVLLPNALMLATSPEVRDGQHALAPGDSNARALPIPVVAVVSDDIEVQREQFILVNQTRPLPTGLIDELLDEPRR